MSTTTNTSSKMVKSRQARGLLLVNNLPQLQNLIKVSFQLRYV